MDKQLVVFTDLDGTLIDFVDYSFSKSEKAVRKLQQAGVPIIFCSSKTYAEQQYYLEALSISAPFIVENGSAIFIPKGYFDFSIEGLQEFNESHDLIMLGSKIEVIRKALIEARSALQIEAEGYGDLSLLEIMEIIKLDSEFSKRAASRDFSETILRVTPEDRISVLAERLADKGYSCLSGGKFHTIVSKHADKGKAVKVLSELLAKKFGQITTIGLGDSANDAPLLDAVDVAYQVQKPPGVWSDLPVQANRVEAIGPEGWALVADQLLQL